MNKAIDGMQSAMETESKGKAEAVRMKKKLEADVAELEMSLEHANSSNVETQKSIKKYQTQIRDVQAKLEGEQREKEVARDAMLAADRKAHAMQNALEEARSLLEQADRNRRSAEAELSDVNESLSEATVQNQSIAAAKRKMESEMQTLHADFDEMSAEAKICEDKAPKGGKKAMNKMETRIRELESELDAEGRRMADATKNLRKSERRIKELAYSAD